MKKNYAYIDPSAILMQVRHRFMTEANLQPLWSEDCSSYEYKQSCLAKTRGPQQCTPPILPWGDQELKVVHNAAAATRRKTK